MTANLIDASSTNKLFDLKSIIKMDNSKPASKKKKALGLKLQISGHGVPEPD